MKNRRGYFCISTKMLDDLINNNPDILAQIFSCFIPLYINCNYLNQKIEYYGVSNKFEELKEGEKIPQYQIIVKNNRVEKWLKVQNAKDD